MAEHLARPEGRRRPQLGAEVTGSDGSPRSPHEKPELKLLENPSQPVTSRSATPAKATGQPTKIRPRSTQHAAGRRLLPPLQLSISAEDEIHLMLSLIQYRETCRRQYIECPAMIDRVVAQLSLRVTEGQAGSTFAAGLQGDDSRSVDPLLVTYADAALMLSWSPSTLKRRVRGGLLEPVRSGRTVRLRIADIENLISQGAT